MAVQPGTIGIEKRRERKKRLDATEKMSDSDKIGGWDRRWLVRLISRVKYSSTIITILCIDEMT